MTDSGRWSFSRPGDNLGAMPRLQPMIEPLCCALIFFCLASYATWPLLSDLDSSLLFASRRFDGYGTIWLGEHFVHAWQGDVEIFHDSSVAWPFGLDLRLADSFLFGLLYPPFRVFFEPVAAFNVFCLAAITATGMGGWWLGSRVLGAGPIGGFAAGFVMAFNSLMHTYRIEGEAYLLAGLFLPLYAGALVRVATLHRIQDGFFAAAMLGALAWSSGYYAIDGMLISLIMGGALAAGAWGGIRRELWRPMLALVLGSALLLGPLAWMVGQALDGALAARFPEGQDPLSNIALDSASLSGLLVPFGGTAHLRQGRIAYAGLAAIILGCAALVPGKRRDLTPWAALAAAGLVLSLGPYLRIDDTEVGSMPLPLAWMIDLIPSMLAYRMPIRFLALTFLGLGVLVALLLKRLRSEGLGIGWQGAILTVLVLDGLAFTGLALDETTATAEVPEGYSEVSGSGAVLDLWGHDRDLLRYAGLSAFYQIEHGQPSVTDFTQANNAQSVLSRRLGLALVQKDELVAAEVISVLKGLGVTDIAFHPGSFQDRDQARVRGGLNSICDSHIQARSTDDSDRVEVFYLPDDLAALSGPEAEARLVQWLEEAS